MAKPTTIDKLVDLARGDVEVVQKAIRLASAGQDRADLGKVTRLVLALRSQSQPPSPRTDGG